MFLICSGLEGLEMGLESNPSNPYERGLELGVGNGVFWGGVYIPPKSNPTIPTPRGSRQLGGGL